MKINDKDLWTAFQNIQGQLEVINNAIQEHKCEEESKVCKAENCKQ